MIGLIFLFICCTRFGESAIFFVKDDEGNAGLTLDMMNLMKMKVDNKANSWKNDLFKFVKSQIDENDSDNNEHMNKPVQLSWEMKASTTQNGYESSTNSLTLCKSLVGTSKLPLCGAHLDNKDGRRIHPRSCYEILQTGNNKSGIYEIQPTFRGQPFAVLCDMETKGGGWTHIQKRFDGSQDFFLQWRDYKFGFGDLSGEFWIGLEHIYLMTGFETSELLVELTDRDKKTAHAQYATFAIGPGKGGYPLITLKGFSGDAGDALTYHLNAKFTTRDLDQDISSGSCADLYEGAWWYVNCFESNLNGKFVDIALPDALKYRAMNWNGFRGKEYNLAGSRMLVRPKGV